MTTRTQEYDPSLFSGTADYYHRFRLGYPNELYEEIFKHVSVREPRLLDLGCGPATITNQIIDSCSEAVLVDPDPEMIAMGKQVVSQHSHKTTFVTATAEQLDFNSIGTFDVVVIGSALHWMNSRELMPKLSAAMNSGGVIALIYSKSAGMNIWQPDVSSQTWQSIVTSVIQKYLGEERKAGGASFVRVKNSDSFEETILKTPDLRTYIQIDVPLEKTWNADDLIGLLYSTSFCRRDYFQNETEIRAFENDMKETLNEHLNGAEKWTETYEATAYVGIKS